MHTPHHRQPRGFTLIEISLTVLLSGILIALVTANYRRANQDSLLQREASLLMSRLRLAQEETASGKSSFFCYHRTGKACTCPLVDGKCDATYNPPECADACCPQNGTSCDAASALPLGGFGMVLSCPARNGVTSYEAYSTTIPLTDLPSILNAKTTYYELADRQNCFGSGTGTSGRCFPTKYDVMSNGGLFPADGLLTLLYTTSDSKGDTFVAKYDVDKQVSVHDLRVTWAKNPPAMAKPWVSCGEDSPWEGKNVPNLYSQARSTMIADYPIQAAIRYAQPDGRNALVSDNVAPYAPLDSSASPSFDTTNPVTSIEVMLALTNRPNASCRVVKVTSSNVVTQSIDADCNFATPN